MEVLAGLTSDLIDRNPTQFRDLFRHSHHKSRFVALATMRDWRKKWRVSLDQHLLDRELLCNLTYVLCLRERDITREGDQKTQLHCMLSMRLLPSKAMQNAAQLRC